MEDAPVQIVRKPAADFYIDALRHLLDSKIPFVVGGGFAFSHYSRVVRETKDIDVFVRSEDSHHVVEMFRRAGFEAFVPYPHWLAKIKRGSHVMDVIYSSGNGIAQVDDLWFEHAPRVDVLGLSVLLSPVEEMVWSKAFVLERERYDGADVAHLLRETGPSLDWPRLLMRFGDHWRVLLSHLILFGFIYPDKRTHIPSWVMSELLRRVIGSRADLANDVCYGTLLSREQFRHDLEQLRYRDGREEPDGNMTAEECRMWSDAARLKD